MVGSQRRLHIFLGEFTESKKLVQRSSMVSGPQTSNKNNYKNLKHEACCIFIFRLKISFQNLNSHLVFPNSASTCQSKTSMPVC